MSLTDTQISWRGTAASDPVGHSDPLGLAATLGGCVAHSSYHGDVLVDYEDDGDCVDGGDDGGGGVGSFGGSSGGAGNGGPGWGGGGGAGRGHVTRHARRGDFTPADLDPLDDPAPPQPNPGECVTGVNFDPRQCSDCVEMCQERVNRSFSRWCEFLEGGCDHDVLHVLLHRCYRNECEDRGRPCESVCASRPGPSNTSPTLQQPRESLW